MSRILLKITNESASYLGTLDVYGATGVCYKFPWDKLMQAFTYLPKSNDEIADLFEMLRVPQFPYRFLPLLVEGDSKSSNPVFSPPPIVKKELYEKYPVEDLLALCADCGFVPADSGSRDHVIAQLSAYYLGRAWREVEKNLPRAPVHESPPPAASPSLLSRTVRRIKSLSELGAEPAKTS